jgi:hypothetical protein
MGRAFSLVVLPYGAGQQGLASHLIGVGLRRAKVGRRLSPSRALAYTYDYENL